MTKLVLGDGSVSDPCLRGRQPGGYVRLRLLQVPSHLWLSRDPAAPLVLFGLLAHEQKMSVLNMVLQRHAAGHQRPIRARQRLIFHLGFRRFAAAPIFSQHTNGDKHKVLVARGGGSDGCPRPGSRKPCLVNCHGAEFTTCQRSRMAN